VKIGYTRVFSGSDGGTLHTLTGFGGGDQFGTSVAHAGDFDGDQYGDILVGAPVNDLVPLGVEGFAQLFSGQTGSSLSFVDGFHGILWPGAFGTSVAATGDLNADGLLDFVVGDPGAGENGWPTGATYVFSGTSFTCTGTYALGGSGLAGLGGLVPRLRGPACPDIGMSNALHVTQGRGGALGVLFAGIAPTAISVFGGTLYLIPIVQLPHVLSGPVNTAGTGFTSVALTIPDNAALIGVVFYFEAMYLDAAAIAGVSQSMLLTMTIG